MNKSTVVNYVNPLALDNNSTVSICKELDKRIEHYNSIDSMSNLVKRIGAEKAYYVHKEVLDILMSIKGEVERDGSND